MPTKFSEFFKLTSNADEFQIRIYNVISDATTMADCYRLIYEYIISGVKWSSRTFRHNNLDSRVDVSGMDQEQLNYAEEYFVDLIEQGPAVQFEFLEMVLQDKDDYGYDVYSLEIRTKNEKAAAAAFEQFRLYWKAQIYNADYDRQLIYHQENDGTTAPPNGKIDIKPDQPLDDAEIQRRVRDLTNWIDNNYRDAKAVKDAKISASALFKLVFDSRLLPAEQQIKALNNMLHAVNAFGYSTPRLNMQFGFWLLDKLNEKKDFWNNSGISPAYAEIKGRENQFKLYLNLEIYDHFKQLFADFLKLKPYGSESESEAKTRAETAFGFITGIFRAFTGEKEITDRYRRVMRNKALKSIKADYANLYTGNLQRALTSVPQMKTILPSEIAHLLKETADECLRTLPLRLQQNGTQVRFFTMHNYADLAALKKESVDRAKTFPTKMSIIVNADPKENGEARYRPIYYRAFVKDETSTDSYPAFCNVHDEPGTFYYVHLQDPFVVQVCTRDQNRTLTIDFQNFTIDYAGKPDKTKNNAGELYRSSGSTSTFYQELRGTTKWKEIDGRRRYEPYYTTNPDDAGKPVGHVMGFMGAAWKATRTLALHDDTLCLWACSDGVRTSFPKLGEILGLPPAREIVPTGGLAQLSILNTVHSVQIGSSQWNLVNYGPMQFQNGFYYQIIGIAQPGKDEQFYVQVNTPNPGIAATLTSHRTPRVLGHSVPLEDNPRNILDCLHFGYFRRITTTIDETTRKPVFTEASKVIQLFTKGDSRVPTGPGTEELPWPDKELVAIGANLPICFNLAENVIKYFEDKRSRGKIINKGDVLYRKVGARKDAATQMRAIHRYLKAPLSTSLSSSKVPASAFATGVMGQSPSARQDWGVLKLASRNYMPISQEWCHLRGHGDGGEEYPGNFVSGSYHCNSEQLSIETGQRIVTQQMTEPNFLLHTTAYLLRDATDYKSSVQAEKESQILADNYLANQETYQRMLKRNTERRNPEVKNSKKKRKQETGGVLVTHRGLQQGDVAPVAAYIRYKVMLSEKVQKETKKRKRGETTETRKKFFDFIFEGQSEFLDVHQSSLISRAVQFALAGAVAFRAWYGVEEAQLEEET